jgi:hypothetical protein
MTKHTRELLGTAVGCFAGYGMLFSLGGGLAQIDLARYLLLAGFGIALLVMLIDIIKGHVFRSIVGVALFCIIGLGAGYFPHWYFQRIVGDGPIFKFGVTTNSPVVVQNE